MTPTGSPDFGQNPASNPSSPVYNQGEVAGRLLMGGGSNSQAGRWLWASGFESGLNEWVESDPLQCTITNDVVYQGANSGLLKTTAVLNNFQFFMKQIFPQGGVFGLECLAAFDIPTAVPREFFIGIGGPHADKGFDSSAYFGVIITALGAANLYISVNNVRTLILNVDDYFSIASAGFFHYFKIVFDTKNNKAIRFYFDDLVFDMGGVAGYKYASTIKYVTGIMTHKTLVAAVAQAWIDNVIITADEPTG